MPCIALDQPQHQALTPFYGGYNPQVVSLGHMTWTLWFLGYPEQALARSQEALQLAQGLAPPLSLVIALSVAARLHIERGDERVAQKCADATIALSSEHGFPLHLAWGTIYRGETLTVQDQWKEGVVQMRQGLEANEADLSRTSFLAWLAAGYGKAGQVEEGLATVAEALWLVDKNDEHFYEAELYRIKGELTRQKEFQVQGSKFQAPNTQHLTPSTQAEVTWEAEKCFLKAIAIAQKQQAKSLELRATMSLARLWQSHGKTAEAHRMLSEIYHWFTEGFDTKDLQEAEGLLEELQS